MRTILFDLEETLIRDWFEDPSLKHVDNPNLIPWIEQQKPFEAGLLSMAVWDERDLAVFNNRSNLRPFIEKTFKFKFKDDLIFLEKDVLDLARKQTCIPFLDRESFGDFFKKKEMMELIWKDRFLSSNSELILLDDTVMDLEIKASKINNCVLRLINPNHI